MKRILLTTTFLLLLMGVASAQADSAAPSPPAPPTGVKAVDKPNDHGHAVNISWDMSPDDGKGANSVVTYDVFRWIPAYMDSVAQIRAGLSGIRDTINILDRANRKWSVLEEHLTGDSAKLANDSVVAAQRIPQLRADLKRFRQVLASAVERLPEAHKTYPENGSWRRVGTVPAGQGKYSNVGSKEYEEPDYLPDFSDFYYRVDAVGVVSTTRSSSEVSAPVHSSGQWFNTGRTTVLVFVLAFGFLTVLFVRKARAGHDLYVRPLAGIDAVDDAIGRATEMGRPILYLLGAGTAADIATIASFTILARVSKKVAEYQTTLIVPCYDPIVMSIAQDIVKTGYSDAGRPDAYKEDMVFFITQSQFAYVAAVNGIMIRDLPATNLYMGKFYAESLIFAETGALAGSIQIAGTDEVAQLPFFVVACDYTLIGEELFAASAYLGREPLLLGTLKAQDYAKAAVLLLAIVGLLAVNVGHEANVEWLMKFKELFKVID
ncbi:MAG: hypothetical protein HY851_03120 [candidate division Zixibacteria bacterium]|nr:hypothetical protein [candidate division Zixibacteria bacterium]